MVDVAICISTDNAKAKMENFIYSKTGKKVDIGELGYNGKLTILTLRDNMNKIGTTNITCFHYFPGKHFVKVDDFIEWYSSCCL